MSDEWLDYTSEAEIFQDDHDIFYTDDDDQESGAVFNNGPELEESGNVFNNGPELDYIFPDGDDSFLYQPGEYCKNIFYLFSNLLFLRPIDHVDCIV